MNRFKLRALNGVAKCELYLSESLRIMLKQYQTSTLWKRITKDVKSSLKKSGRHVDRCTLETGNQSPARCPDSTGLFFLSTLCFLEFNENPSPWLPLQIVLVMTRSPSFTASLSRCICRGPFGSQKQWLKVLMGVSEVTQSWSSLPGFLLSSKVH